jgi:hypothetical protein
MGEIYNKTVIDLSAKEMMMIYDRHQNRQYLMLIPRFDKTGIVINLASLQPNLFLNLEKKYFYRKTGNNIKYDPDYQGGCEQKKARTDHVLNIEKINELIMLNNFNAILTPIIFNFSTSTSSTRMKQVLKWPLLISSPDSQNTEAQILKEIVSTSLQ